MKKIWAIGFVLAATASGSLGAGEGFAIHGGDRVVFLGDSITEQRLYTTYIEAYTVTRFPEQEFHFYNRGWGGDTAWLRMRSFPDEDALFAADGEEQQRLIDASVKAPFQRDVLEVKPTLVCVNFGMNDHNYEAFREDIFNAYVRGQTLMAQTLATNGIRAVLLTPQPIENRSGDPLADARNQALRKFADGLGRVAANEGAMFVDQFDPYMAIMRRAHEGNTNTCIGGGDEVHPGPVGHTLMAAIILERLHAPALVSSVAFDLSDASAPTLVNAAQCSVSNITLVDGILGFDRADECLPMPVDERATGALALAPVLDRLNRYMLKAEGLTDGHYDLWIDGEWATTACREDWAGGWNLATTAGPVTRQAREVLALIFKKNLVELSLWEASLRAWRKAELPGLEQQVEALEALINAARQPRVHRFELRPIDR